MSDEVTEAPQVVEPEAQTAVTVPGGPFVPGYDPRRKIQPVPTVEVVVNGKVVPKTDYELRFRKAATRKAQKLVEKAYKTLEEVMDTATNPNARVAAAKEIMNRALGAATTEIKHSGSIAHEHVSYTDLLRQVNEIKKARIVEAEYEEAENAQISDGKTEET